MWRDWKSIGKKRNKIYHNSKFIINLIGSRKKSENCTMTAIEVSSSIMWVTAHSMTKAATTRRRLRHQYIWIYLYEKLCARASTLSFNHFAQMIILVCWWCCCAKRKPAVFYAEVRFLKNGNLQGKATKKITITFMQSDCDCLRLQTEYIFSIFHCHQPPN